MSVSAGGFIVHSNVGDPQILRQAVLGGHVVFEPPAHRLDLDAAGHVGGERVGQQVPGGFLADAARAEVEDMSSSTGPVVEPCVHFTSSA